MPGDRGVGGGHVEARQGHEAGPGVEALGEGVEVQARRQRAGRQHTVLWSQTEVLRGRFERAPPGAAAALEALGQGRGARGQADQEGRGEVAVAQFRRGWIGGEARRAALPHLRGQVLRPGRVQDGAYTFLGHPGGPPDGEVRAVGLSQDPRGLARGGQGRGPGAQIAPAQPVVPAGDGELLRALLGPAGHAVQKGHVLVLGAGLTLRVRQWVMDDGCRRVALPGRQRAVGVPPRSRR